MSLRVGILECDHVDDRFRGIGGDYTDMFAGLLEVDLVPYDACNGVLPAAPDECDGWLATGSRWSVYDDLAWIGALSGFVRDVRDAGAPFVGICFGHQLLAHALGGRTEQADIGWGVGAIDTSLPAPPTDARLLYMHQDQVTVLPDGAVVLGRADHCPIAALQLGAMLGVQAHPEFAVDYVDALLDARVDRIGPAVTARAKASLALDAIDDDSARVGRWIVDFLGTAR